MPVRRGKLEGKVDYRPHAMLLNGAKVLIKKSSKSEEGSFHTTLASILFSTFAFEGYLNWFLSKKSIAWPQVEKLSTLDKWEIASKLVGVGIDKSKRPSQTIVKMFKFRNDVAHPRSTVKKFTSEVIEGNKPYGRLPAQSWEEFCTDENAQRCIDDVRKVADSLQVAAKLSGLPFAGTSAVNSITWESSG